VSPGVSETSYIAQILDVPGPLAFYQKLFYGRSITFVEKLRLMVLVFVEIDDLEAWAMRKLQFISSIPLKHTAGGSIQS
jgi:hypothetical protein